jgi:hypothetical protein
MKGLLFFLLCCMIHTSYGQQSRFSMEKMLPAPMEGSFQMDGYWVWGASVVEDGGMYHMYVTRVPKSYKFHPGWMIAGEIVHAVSERPEGPYRFHDVALGPRGAQYWDGCSTYNPQIRKHKGRFYLFYGGTRHPYMQPSDKELTLQSKWCISSRFNKRIGIAVADSPYGPWQRPDKPSLDVEPNTFYSYLASNPAPEILSNGHVYMIFKGRAHTGEGKYSKMHLGVAYAESPDSPLKVLNEKKPVFVQGEAEDPFLWKEGSYFYATFKDHRGEYTGEQGGGVLARSKDCIQWEVCHPAKAYSKTIRWADGRTTEMGNMERPFILFINGMPAYMFFATMNGTHTGFDGQEARNIVIPLSVD